MNFEQVVQLVGNLALVSAFPGLLLFLLFYGVVSKWRTHAVGRALFWMTVSLALTVFVFVLRLIIGDQWFWLYVRVPIFAFVSFSVWRMFVVLRIIQLEKGGSHAVPRRADLEQGND